MPGGLEGEVDTPGLVWHELAGEEVRCRLLWVEDQDGNTTKLRLAVGQPAPGKRGTWQKGDVSFWGRKRYLEKIMKAFPNHPPPAPSSLERGGLAMSSSVPQALLKWTLMGASAQPQGESGHRNAWP